MENYYLVIILIVILFTISALCFCFNLHKSKNYKLKIIVPLYNPGILNLQKCLKSIENQTYKNYDVCIIEDASTKESTEIRNLIKTYVGEQISTTRVSTDSSQEKSTISSKSSSKVYKQNKNWEYIFNDINGGAMNSYVIGINKLKPNDEDIIIIIDGDDELYDNSVFEKINNIYKKNDINLTFGNYIVRSNDKFYKSKHIVCDKYDWVDIVKNNKFREMEYIFSHLKTFKYKLFKNIKPEDLKRNGKYISSSNDLTIMIPMMEMSGSKFKCISDLLYIYNKDNPESHANDEGKRKIQKSNQMYIKSLPKYTPIP